MVMQTVAVDSPVCAGLIRPERLGGYPDGANVWQKQDLYSPVRYVILCSPLNQGKRNVSNFREKHY